MFNKLKSIYDNFLHDATHWSYSIPFSLFIVGSLLLVLGTIDKKIWKIILTLLGFLITLASFVKLIIEIL